MTTTLTHQLDELFESERLPSPSGVALRILELTRDPEASLDELQTVLAADPALAGRIIHYASSAKLSPTGEIRSLAEAIVRLGLRTVRQVALGFSVLANARGGPCVGFDYNGFWARSLATAVGAQSVAALVKGCSADDAFTCGLLGDIGRLALASVHPDKYAGVLERWSGRDDQALRQLEREVLLIDHAEVSASMLERWGLPGSNAGAIRDLALGREDTPLAQVLRIARAMADICIAGGPAREALVDVLLELASARGFDREALLLAVDEALLEWERLGDVLDIVTEDIPSLDVLSARSTAAPLPAVDLDEVLAYLDVDTSTATPVDPGQAPPLRIVAALGMPAERTGLASWLEPLGHEVEVLTGGREAMERALRWDPHVVLADWDLPDLGGLEICDALRQAEAASELFIILASNTPARDGVIRSLGAGADEYLTLPLDRDVFLARLQAVQRAVYLRDRAAHDREALRSFAAELGLANRKLQHLALHDILTGLPNRRYAMDRLDKEFKRARRHDLPLVCLLVDVDHLEAINDHFGHTAGDHVIRHAAHAMRDALRASDDICRFGDDDFLAICPGADLVQAEAVADRIRRSVADLYIDEPEYQGQATISIGVATATADTLTAADMLKLAADGLSAAKAAGRNRACLVSLDPPTTVPPR